ncbi:voltage-gated chloride channel family protein [Clostridium rectalis]|uniref:voltage-gated chloride channel family protein n=1 Tax=Clostridium rectalis TaxID=2040295 RepID=UPI001FA99C74|nr:voltage-gated chloride channel family protein [Clostridium rectalis]
MKRIENNLFNSNIKSVFMSHSIKYIYTFLRWIVLGGLIGILTGTAAAFFLKSLQFATNKRLELPWLLFFLPFGGMLVSYVYMKYGKDSSKGNNLILEQIHESQGKIPVRMGIFALFGTVITHLFGGSAGREGTGVQIGASIAEGVSNLFKLDRLDRNILLMSGISSGFASVFGTPLAGTIFGMEIIFIGIINYEALVPCTIAAFIGDFITNFWGVKHTHYIVGVIPSFSTKLMFKIIIIGIIFGLISKIFSELTHKLKKMFSIYFKNTIIKSAVGGIIVIILVYIVGNRNYLGLSIPLMMDAFKYTSKIQDFILKTIFTSLTLGSGYQGGEVTPLFVIGSTLGSFMSGIMNEPISFFASLGLIGVFAGATNAPIASFIMGIELFGSDIGKYMFIICVTSYLFSGHSSIYSAQKIGMSKTKFISLPRDITVDKYGESFYPKKDKK